ncbi:MAG: PilN domain-containing protein [Pyrinomonadaceae bacterium]
MIKINLLNSVTERQGGAIMSVERKVASPMSRLLLMCIAVAFLLLSLIGFDIINTNRNKANAEEALQEQQKIATELEAVLQEQKQLEENIKNIDARIDAIKKLRASQAGPSAVLEAVRERIAMTPGLFLDSIEQSGEQITVKGNSPDEQAVTQFGRSLEFSAGLFSNLSIETQRKEITSQNASATPGATDPKLEIVNFIIRCAYTPSKAEASKNSATTATANQAQSNNTGNVNQAANTPPPAPVAPATDKPKPPQIAQAQ